MMKQDRIEIGLWIGGESMPPSGQERAAEQDISAFKGTLEVIFHDLARCHWIAHSSAGAFLGKESTSTDAAEPLTSEVLGPRLQIVKGDVLVRFADLVQDDFLLLFGSSQESFIEHACRTRSEDGEDSSVDLWYFLWENSEICLYGEEGHWSVFSNDQVLEKLRHHHQERSLRTLLASEIFDGLDGA